MNISELKADVDEEVGTILSGGFTIEVTEAQSVPHSDDGAITFPNLDTQTQGTKLIETAVLYVDMRRSTQLSLQHQPHTVAKLYSAFVRGMTRCANYFGGEVRGIIGDRVMVLFEPKKCFENAIDTAELMNSVCEYVINKKFAHDEVTFGIGIDYGRMLATKTGIRRHGAAQQSYRSLVWLGRPANVASKLTDQANKPEESMDLIWTDVTYDHGWGPTVVKEAPHLFIQNFRPNASGNYSHINPAYRSFQCRTEKAITRPATPAILLSKRVYDGFRRARPDAIEFRNGLFKVVDLKIPGHTEAIYGCGVTYEAFWK